MRSDLGGIPVYINSDRDALIGHAELFGDERSKVAQIVITCDAGSAQELEAMLVQHIPVALSFVYEPVKREIPKYLVRQVREVLVDAENPGLARDLGFQLLKDGAPKVRVTSLEVFRED